MDKSLTASAAARTGGDAVTDSTEKDADQNLDQNLDKDPEQRAEQLEQEIEEIRDNLGGLVSELDHRRHRLNPLNAINRNPWPVALGGVVLIGAVLGGIALYGARVRKRESLMGRGQRLRWALQRAMDKPDKVAKEQPNMALKILSAAGTAAAAVVARKFATRIVSRAS